MNKLSLVLPRAQEKRTGLKQNESENVMHPSDANRNLGSGSCSDPSSLAELRA